MTRVILPDGWPRPKGYSNGIVSTGPLLHVAGMIGWEPDGAFASERLVDQLGRALDHVLAVVRAAGSGPEDVVRMTVYVTAMDEYRGSLAEIGAVWRERMGRSYPVMALVGVTSLVEPGAKVEIEAVATVREP